MDNIKLILTGAVSPPVPLENINGASFYKTMKQLESREISGLSEEQKKQAAKDFESVLLNKLVDEMKNTIGEWGFDKDGTCEQVQGIFWLYLARHISDNGGLGLWKDIYKFLTDSGGANAVTK
ncbi:MAG TPA: hypothetical protein VMW16_00530 [Sedimentisphaerales bacterium]|nr:hypothetical protein [Sedimentisphaerales bacterium]